MRKSRIIISVLAFVLVLSMSGCNSIDYKYSPECQKNCQWVSDDGSLFISSYGEKVSGYISYCGIKIPIYFFATFRANVFVYYRLSENICVETEDIWIASYRPNTAYLEIRTSLIYDSGATIRLKKLGKGEEQNFDDGKVLDEFAPVAASVYQINSGISSYFTEAYKSISDMGLSDVPDITKWSNFDTNYDAFTIQLFLISNTDDYKISNAEIIADGCDLNAHTVQIGLTTDSGRYYYVDYDLASRSVSNFGDVINSGLQEV
ncbi:MAG: hypothetical protein ACI4SJ_02140 [Candidatus Avispirillum sp.]